MESGDSEFHIAFFGDFPAEEKFQLTDFSVSTAHKARTSDVPLQGSKITESARACSYYSVSTGMQIGEPLPPPRYLSLVSGMLV